MNLPDSCSWTPAEYYEQQLDDFRDNPLLEALHPIRESRDLAKALTCRPTYNQDMRSLSPATRQHATEKILSFVQPLSIHIDLAHRLSRLIRNGYLARNPVAAAYRRDMEAGLAAARQKRRLRGPRATGMAIAGLSGVGKTTGIEAVLEMDPQVIVHTEYKSKPFIHTQVVHLELQCPADSSVRGLCINFIRAMDSLLGTEYESRYVRYKSTVEVLLSYMARIACAHSLGVLVVDEIQNLAAAKSGGERVMLNFFSELVNTIGVPVVLVGTPKAVDVLTKEFRHARRGTGQGDMFWDRMQRTTDEQEAEWRFFCEQLWRYQFTAKPTPLTPAICDALYDNSQGITDVVVKLYMLAQDRAIQTGRESITPGLIKSVAKDSLRSIRRVLEALRTGTDLAFLKKCDDVLSDGLKRIVDDGREASDRLYPVATPAPSPSAKESPPTIPPAAPPRTRRARAPRPKEGPNLLTGIVSHGLAAGMSAYDALKQAGEIAADAEAA